MTECGFRDISVSKTCGEGVCLEAFAPRGCVCPEGFTGRSDWVNLEGYDCHVSLVAIRVMWSCILTLTVANYFIVGRPLFNIAKKFITLRQAARSQGKNYTLLNNSGALMVVVEYLGAAPIMLVVCLYKIFDESPRVGIDPGITVLWMGFRACFYIGIDVYQTALFSQMLKSERNMTKMIVANTWVTHVITGAAICVQFVAIPVLLDPSDLELGRKMFIVYFVGLTTTWVAIALQSRVISSKVEKVLMASYAISKDDKTLHVLDQLILHQKNTFKQVVFQVVVHVAFAAIPKLYGMHDYYLPFTWIFPNLAMIQATNAIGHRFKDAQKSSQGRGSIFGAIFGRSTGVRRRSQSTADHSSAVATTSGRNTLVAASPPATAENTEVSPATSGHEQAA